MRKDLVVVTGASGYIGSHIVANLLSKGRNVRATVRDTTDPERTVHLSSLPVGKNGSLEIVEMDLLDENSVNMAISGCKDVIHTAAAVIIKSKNPQKDIVDPSVIGTKNVLLAIEKNGEVKNFIHTSSTAAIRPKKWKNGIVLTTETFAEDATLDANPYGLAKYSAEMMVRKWYKNSKSGLRMLTIHPCMVFGPPMSKRHLHGSLAILMMLIKRKLPMLLPMQISIVDVRDVAEVHVKALSMGINGGRYLVVAGEMMWDEMAKLLKKEFPKRRWVTKVLPYRLAFLVAALHPKVTMEWAKTHLKNKLYWDSRPAAKDFQISWRNPETTILETMPNIIENDWDK
jgi:dihydroflavonol-4-reductase